MSEDTTPVSRSSAKSSERTPIRHNSLKDAGTPYRGRYKATTLWNNIIRHFRDEMPIKRHRRQLTYFEDTFTGKEAVDFLLILLPRLIFEGRQVERSNCVTLLQKFLDQGFIERVRPNPGEKAIFKDNAALYVFVDDCDVFGMSKTPRLVRSNSCTERSGRQEDVSAKLTSVQPFKSPDSFNYLRIPTPVANKGFNRRMSSSHGNLLALLPQKTGFDSADSLAETIDSRRVEVNFNLRPSPVKEYNTPVVTNIQRNSRERRKKVSLTEKKKSPAVAKSPDSKSSNIPSSKREEIEKEGAYEWLNFVRRKKPLVDHNKAISNPHSTKPHQAVDEPPEVVEHRKKYSHGAAKSKMPDPTYCPIQITHRYVTEIDSWSIWKNCLLSRLCRILCQTSLPFITWAIDGQDVKWNCQRVGTSGVVKSRTDREDFSGYLLRLMRYLEQFPFPSGSANIITYKDNQEVNVFRTVCSHLAQEAPMLTNTEACALNHVISLLYEKDFVGNVRPTGREGSCDVRIETEFSANVPRTRIVPRIPHYVSTTSTSSSHSSYVETCGRSSAVSRNGADSRQPPVCDGDDTVRTSSVLSTVSHPPLKSVGQGRHNTYLLEGLPEYDEILNLPGLKESPDLMKRLDELCLKPRSTSKISCRSSSESVKLPDLNEVCRSGCGSRSLQAPVCPHVATPLEEELRPRPSDSLLEALSLVLLSIPSSRRRKLHYLIRFMNKLSANHCLQLDELHSNREAVLRGLSRCIVSLRGSPTITAPQRAHLVSILLDHEKKVFGVPKGLVAEVEEAIRERQREKVMPTEQYMVRKPVPGASSVQFFDPIKTCNYEEQNDYLNQNLLELLEQICCDENLSVIQKRKRLRKFKKTYPAVYSQRFPSPELTHSRKKDKEGSLFSRLFGR